MASDYFYPSLQILQFNVHSVMTAVVKENESFSMESIGSAIYASFAFLNHSCNPNTIKYWEVSREITVMVTQCIISGGQNGAGGQSANQTRPGGH